MFLSFVFNLYYIIYFRPLCTGEMWYVDTWVPDVPVHKKSILNTSLEIQRQNKFGTETDTCKNIRSKRQALNSGAASFENYLGYRILQ